MYVIIYFLFINNVQHKTTCTIIMSLFDVFLSLSFIYDGKRYKHMYNVGKACNYI